MVNKEIGEDRTYEILRGDLAGGMWGFINDNLKDEKGLFYEDFDKPIVMKCLATITYFKKNPERYRNAWIKWAKEQNKKIIKEKPKKKKIKAQILTRRGQIEAFWEEQPFFYDKNRIFWLWDKENKKWAISDEVDYLNSIQQILGVETIGGKVRSELVEGFKQIGRKHKPKDIKKTWVQFKDKIYDVKTGESFEATPEYFVTNPIPYEVGKSEDIPTIDKYFDDWIEGQDISWKKTLYEIIAYIICSDCFMQRVITLCGGGSNGKGTFIKLIYKFIGEENHTTSEIKALSEHRFEASGLYRKLLCVMGEVGYDDLKNTNMLKKIAGEDKLSFEFKGKDRFTADNTATCLCLTNALPTTPDTSIGFYRKWLIIDFLKQFPELNEDLIGKIPDEEFNNLAKKCLRILKELYKKPKFTNEGDFNERIKRYEERSNPVMNFVEECCEEEAGENTPLRDVTNSCNEYLKKKHLRILTAKQVGKVLREEGFVVGARKINDISCVAVMNLRIKYEFKKVNVETIETIETIKI